MEVEDVPNMRTPTPFHSSTVAAKDRLAGPCLGRCVGNSLLILHPASDLKAAHRQMLGDDK